MKLEAKVLQTLLNRLPKNPLPQISILRVYLIEALASMKVKSSLITNQKEKTLDERQTTYRTEASKYLPWEAISQIEQY